MFFLAFNNKHKLYHDTFMPVLFVKVSEHADTSKYLDKSVERSYTFLQIIAVSLH